MFNTPPVEALIMLKKMQENLKARQKLEFEFIYTGSQLSTIYGMKPEEITDWLKNGRSDV
jgi:hypothetical protein